MNEKAVRGIPWSLLAFSGSKGVTVASTLILARLLSPTDFGLVALGLLVFELLNLLSDAGLTAVLVARQDLDDRAKGTVLTLLLVLGGALALLLFGLAPLISMLFGEPRLTGVLQALAVMAFVSGFGWFYAMILQRELEFRSRFLSHMARSVSTAAVALGLAVAGAGVWSLVAGQVAGQIGYSLALIILTPYRVRPTVDLQWAREVLRSGSGFMVQAGAESLQQNADYFAVGGFLGTAQLGFYSMAYRLGELPYAAIAAPIARVTFPLFARMRHAGEDVSSAYLLTLRLVALATCPLGVVLSGAAAPFVDALLGDKWLPSIGPVAVLGLWAAVRPLESTVLWLLNSIGEATVSGRLSMVILVPLVPGASLAAIAGGATAVAWVLVAHAFVLTLMLATVTARRTEIGLGRQWVAIRPVVFAGVGTWLATRAVADAAEATPALATLSLSVAVGCLAYLLLVRLLAPPLLGQAWTQARRALGRTSTSGPTRAEA